MNKFCAVIYFLLTSCIATAQLCTGSLGDPVVNISFGNAATIAAPLKAGITNLSYVPNDCTNDGNYAIISNSQNCFGSTWHSISDHTGDAGGT